MSTKRYFIKTQDREECMNKTVLIKTIIPKIDRMSREIAGH